MTLCVYEANRALLHANDWSLGTYRADWALLYTYFGLVFGWLAASCAYGVCAYKGV